MKRYDLLDDFEGGRYMGEEGDGDWVSYEDAAELQRQLDALGAAVDKLLACKGRFHTEQNYKALETLRKEMKGNAK